MKTLKVLVLKLGFQIYNLNTEFKRPHRIGVIIRGSGTRCLHSTQKKCWVLNILHKRSHHSASAMVGKLQPRCQIFCRLFPSCTAGNGKLQDQPQLPSLCKNMNCHGYATVGELSLFILYLQNNNKEQNIWYNAFQKCKWCSLPEKYYTKLQRLLTFIAP